MKLKAVNKNVVVEFEGTTGGKMDTIQSAGGIVIPVQSSMGGFSDHIGLKDRWGVVKSVGGKVKSDIKVGDRVLVESGKWTEGVQVAGEWMWMTWEEHVIMVDDLFRNTNGKQKATSDADML